MNTASIVSRVWSFCTTLRDDGVGYVDYLEQLTYLIFLKMVDEYAKPPYNRNVGIPQKYNWQTLKPKRGAELEVHYVTLLRELGSQKGPVCPDCVGFGERTRITRPCPKSVDMRTFTQYTA